MRTILNFKISKASVLVVAATLGLHLQSSGQQLEAAPQARALPIIKFGATDAKKIRADVKADAIAKPVVDAKATVSSSKVDPDALIKAKMKRQIIKSDSKKMVEGGIATGGGQTILSNGNLGLLDFFVLSPGLFYSKDSGIKIPDTENLTRLGLDSFYIKDLGLMDDMIDLLARWSTKSGQAVRILQAALNSTRFIFIDRDFNYQDSQFYLPEIFNAQFEERKTAALYLPPYGVIISKPRFEKLSRTNQIGLLTHELFRNLQITYKLKISNQDLQRLTVQLIKGPAINNLGLNENILGDFILATNLTKLSSSEVRLSSFAKDYCSAQLGLNVLYNCSTLMAYASKLVRPTVPFASINLNVPALNKILLFVFNSLTRETYNKSEFERRKKVQLSEDAYSLIQLLNQARLDCHDTLSENEADALSIEIITLVSQLENTPPPATN